MPVRMLLEPQELIQAEEDVVLRSYRNNGFYVEFTWLLHQLNFKERLAMNQK